MLSQLIEGIVTPIILLTGQTLISMSIIDQILRIGNSEVYHFSRGEKRIVDGSNWEEREKV